VKFLQEEGSECAKMNTIPVTLEYEMYLNSAGENGDEAAGVVPFILSFLTLNILNIPGGNEKRNRMGQ
jgi:hypothetical protein